MSRSADKTHPRGTGRARLAEVTTVTDEEGAVKVANMINSRTRHHNIEARIERRKAADKAKIKLPTFRLPN